MNKVVNKQKVVKIETHNFLKFTTKVKKTISLPYNNYLLVVFVSNEEILSLNNEFRNKNSITDVLSFHNETDEFDFDENYLGDIVISAEQASQQAIEHNLSLELEIKQLILHGILHLSGYDHETDNGEMNELELKLRDRLKIN